MDAWSRLMCRVRSSASRPRFAIVLILLVGLAACSDKPPGISTEAEAAKAWGPVTTATTPTPEAAAPNTADYNIGVGDQLAVNVFQVQDLNRTVQVDTAGNISLPLIGTVEVAGKSTAAAEKLIADKLSESYLQSPQVSVLVTQSAQKVSVNGAVQRPGVVTISSPLTLTQAVAEAGGPSDVANPRRVHIARLMPDKRVKDTVFDLSAIQMGKLQDPQLQRRDIVVVEESGSRVTLKSIKDLLPFGFLAGAFL